MYYLTFLQEVNDLYLHKRLFRVLIWTSFTGQFVHLVGGDGVKGLVGGYGSFSWVYYFIGVHEDLMQHPGNNTFIFMILISN